MVMSKCTDMFSSFVIRYQDFDAEIPWHEGSYFQALYLELEAWRRCLPTNFAFEERNMFTFRASCHLDIFLMTHLWYHQSCCELFGAWMPGHAGYLLALENTPDHFLQQCRERSLSHARHITQLVRKVLKVEPDHLFRDAWFGLCLLDSIRIQIAALVSVNEHDGDEIKEETINNLNLCLSALNNTRRTIPLAEKIVSQPNVL